MSAPLLLVPASVCVGSFLANHGLRAVSDGRSLRRKTGSGLAAAAAVNFAYRRKGFPLFATVFLSIGSPSLRTSMPF